MTKHGKPLGSNKQTQKFLLQQCLRGEWRFKHSKTPWKECYLGELFDERSETNRPDLPLLAITKNRGVIPASEVDRKDASSEDKSKYKRIAPGDIGYNTMRMWQGVSAVSQLEGIVSPAYTICIPRDNIDAIFMGYYFKFTPVVHTFWRHSQGLVDDTLSLKFHNFSRIKLKIPPIEEQRFIAELLSAADSEIQLIEKKITALEKQKRGLMQKLLTGQLHVKV